MGPRWGAALVAALAAGCAEAEPAMRAVLIESGRICAEPLEPRDDLRAPARAGPAAPPTDLLMCAGFLVCRAFQRGRIGARPPELTGRARRSPFLRAACLGQAKDPTPGVAAALCCRRHILKR